MKNPYISRVKIKNFRNFHNIDVNLSHKQVIIGENNVGKTNFLRAIQIILDPKLSDDDRYLSETDFFDGLESPIEKGEEIEISIEIKGFEHNKTLLSLLSDATVSDQPPTLRLTYRYYPQEKEDGTKIYEYIIFQGVDCKNLFNHNHRKYLNIKVVNAIRDVESEMKNLRKSPINQLIKQYEIDKLELEDITKRIKEQSNDILSIDEINDLIRNINNQFSRVVGIQHDSHISFETIDIDPNRVLNTLHIMIGETKKRPTSETSLGLNNLLYITLINLSLKDRTVPSFIRGKKYDDLFLKDEERILIKSYEINEKGNYFLKEDIEEEIFSKLYSFMDTNYPSNEGFTILAIEEPEAHLHPTLQRIIYKDLIRGNTSILMTTHSPHITSVAPLESIVHLRRTSDGSLINTTADLELSEFEKKDLERFIDVKRGEIYFGKGVILVEGIAEEYLIPCFAELLGNPLDQMGIIVCNINSTNFYPYTKFLRLLGIPSVIITDGDFYIKVKDQAVYKKYFHVMNDKEHKDKGYLGLELIGNTLIKLGVVEKEHLSGLNFAQQDNLFRRFGFFIGNYTLEVDIMESSSDEESKQRICNVFNEISEGGKVQKRNFKNELDGQEFWKCLSKIEGNGIGKGRFAQAFSNVCTVSHIPEYIEEAIFYIIDKVDESVYE